MKAKIAYGALCAWSVLAFAGVANAQTAFRVDGEDPRQGIGPKLFDVVCPERVVSVKEVEYVCPEFTSFPGENFDWSLERATQGHFLSPVSEDAVLSMKGCEPHAENFGGTILLTRRSDRWIMLWYEAGVDTDQCHKVPLRDGRGFSYAWACTERKATTRGRSTLKICKALFPSRWPAAVRSSFRFSTTARTVVTVRTEMF